MVVFGDFNAIMLLEERWGVNCFGSPFEELISLVELLELQDLPLVKLKFTFFDSGYGSVWSRLDIFLVRDTNSGWSERVMQQAIFKFTSDHLPIALS